MMIHICKLSILTVVAFALSTGCTPKTSDGAVSEDWMMVDDFETGDVLFDWTKIDAQNDTEPYVPNAQISKIQRENGNGFLIRKPAAEGIVGNRKALIYKPLPTPIPVGETFTLYTRVNVEYFPNNHSYGLTNIVAKDIAKENYNAFEPTIRITDKMESNGLKNNGTLMVLSGYKEYSKIQNPNTQTDAKPMDPAKWYEVWAIINNAAEIDGGQNYSIYVRGGEFKTQTKVYSDAKFRMKRELPLIGFIAITNTGPKKSPYGNGGVRYDDIYLAKGRVLSAPQLHSSIKE